MASTLNAKTVHRDGKTELKIGLDDDSKILEGHEGTLVIKNADGSDAKIARENIPFLPDNVSESNKLVTQEDMKAMMNELQNILQSTLRLAKIVGGLDDGSN